MPLDALVETNRKLRELGEKHAHAAVGFSGGRDSRVILDLAVRTFKKVTPFYMELVPGLRSDDEVLAIAAERYGLEVLRVQHWAVYRWLKSGWYNWEPIEYETLEQPTLFDIHDDVLARTGATVVVTGSKRADSQWARQFLASDGITKREKFAAPISGWRYQDVTAYLQAQKIPIPVQDGTVSSGIDLTSRALCWLHEKYPDDFAKLERQFPFIGAAVARKAFFGSEGEARRGS